MLFNPTWTTRTLNVIPSAYGRREKTSLIRSLVVFIMGEGAFGKGTMDGIGLVESWATHVHDLDGD